MGYLGGIHFWWPKMTGRRYPESWARLAALIIFIGFNLTFFPAVRSRLYRDAAPLPRLSAGVSSVERHVDGRGFDPGCRLSAAFDLSDLVFTLRRRRRSESLARQGLEWQTPSPPPTENFERTPIVTEGAYAYEKDPEEIYCIGEAGPCLR